MRIDHSIRIGFPKLADWIEREIPLCRHNTQIWRAFVRWGQFTHRIHVAEQALANNGLAPTIDVAIIDSYGEYRGEIRRRHLNKILLSREWCRKFNKKAKDGDQLTESWELFMKANILHEMVHWADWTADRRAQPNANVWDRAHQRWMYDADVGFQFEEEAFYGIYSDRYLD